MTPIPSFIPLTPLTSSPEGYRGLATDRVLRHFAVTCAERLDTPHKSQHFNDLLAACRNFADGFISRKSLDDYREAHLRTPWLTNANSAAHNCADYFAYEAAYISAYWSSLGSPAIDPLPQSCLLTLHIGPTQMTNPVIHYTNEEAGCPEDIADFVWIVVDYVRGDYEGSGDAVGMKTDGHLYHKGLGHCSCYGPGDEVSWERLADDWQDKFTDLSSELVLKVQEFVASHNPLRWSPAWRTEATANLAEQIAEGNLGLAGPLHDVLYDLGCDNEVWLRILRECPEIIRPGMWFWDRLRGIGEERRSRVAEHETGFASTYNIYIMG